MVFASLGGKIFDLGVHQEEKIGLQSSLFLSEHARPTDFILV
jgi:hypothetical protein